MADKKPFNDAIDHINKMEGNVAGKSVNMKGLPKGIRWIGYFIKIAVLAMIIFSLMISFLD